MRAWCKHPARIFDSYITRNAHQMICNVRIRRADRRCAFKRCLHFCKKYAHANELVTLCAHSTVGAAVFKVCNVILGGPIILGTALNTNRIKCDCACRANCGRHRRILCLLVHIFIIILFTSVQFFYFHLVFNVFLCYSQPRGSDTNPVVYT